MRIYWPISLLVLICAAYSAWWFYAADAVENEIAAMAQGGGTDGVTLAYDAVDVGGFPFRIEATFTHASMRWRGGSWQAERLVAHAMAWQPNHIIAEAGGVKSLTLITAPGETTTIAPDVFRMSAILSDNARFRVDLVFAGATIASKLADGRRTELYVRKLAAHVRATQVGSADVIFDADDIELRRGFITTLGSRIATARFDAALKALPTGDASPLAQSLESWPDFLAAWSNTGGRFVMNALEFNWGEFSMTAKGELTLESDGSPAGQVRLDVAGSDALISALRQGGADYADTAAFVVDIFSLIGRADGARDAITLPLRIANGEIALDPTGGN